MKILKTLALIPILFAILPGAQANAPRDCGVELNYCDPNTDTGKIRIEHKDVLHVSYSILPKDALQFTFLAKSPSGKLDHVLVVYTDSRDVPHYIPVKGINKDVVTIPATHLDADTVGTILIINQGDNPQGSSKTTEINDFTVEGVYLFHGGPIRTTK